jgi:hypothetical protein
MDAQGAEWLEPFSISAPPTFQESILVSQYPGGYQVSCSNCFNGSIAVQVEGGTPPYTVIWEDTSDIPNPFLRQNLGGKLYHYSILDSNQCKIKGYVDLAEPKFSGWQLSGNTEIDANTQYLGTNDTSSFVVKTNAELALKINGAGNMGIGSEPSAAKLNVNGLLEGQGGIKLPNLNTFNDTASVSLQNFRLLAVDENGNFSKLGSSFPIADLLPNTKSCTQNAEGQFLSEWRYQAGSPALATIGVQDCLPMVGIGTTTPQARLDVNGNSIIQGSLNIGVLNEFENFTLNVQGSSQLSGKLVVGNALQENLPNQNLIVNGTALLTQQVDEFNPTLQVEGRTEINGGLTVQTENSINFQLNQNNAWGYGLKIDVNRADMKALALLNNSNAHETFLIMGDGSVTIGNAEDEQSTGTSRLKVHGLISARSLKILPNGMPFPDYVFDQNYHLKTIQELSAYIKLHKHLPNIPSAADVAASNEIDVLNLQFMSLEKIEELFMYIIQLEERIKLLEERQN